MLRSPFYLLVLDDRNEVLIEIAINIISSFTLRSWVFEMHASLKRHAMAIRFLLYISTWRARNVIIRNFLKFLTLKICWVKLEIFQALSKMSLLLILFQYLVSLVNFIYMALFVMISRKILG